MAERGRAGALVRVEKGDERDSSGIGVGTCVVLGVKLYWRFGGGVDEWSAEVRWRYQDFRRVDSEEDRSALQRDLDLLLRWPEVWQMKFNVDKCEVMHLGIGNACGNNVMSGGLQGLWTERDLGVRIMNDLKAFAHCAYVCSMANRVLGMINRTMVHRSPKILTGLYKSQWKVCSADFETSKKREVAVIVPMLPGSRFFLLQYIECIWINSQRKLDATRRQIITWLPRSFGCSTVIV